MASLLSVKNLQVKFATRKSFVTAVDDFSLNIDPGECVGLVGESGCGKTTSGLAVMRLLPGNGHIASGTIELEGVDLSTLSEKEMQHHRGRSVALIPQDPMSSLNPTMKIGRQIGEGLRIHNGASDEEARKRSLEVLDMVEMPRPAERLDQYPFELSGGLRQRVIIAMGLVCEPKLLIADEPTTALDVTIQAQIIELMNEMQQRLGSAIVLITHDLGVVAETCKNVLVMYGGNMVEYGTADDIFNRPKMPYTMGLLESLPRLDVDGERLIPIEGQPPNLLRMPPGCAFAPRCRYKMPMCDQPVPLYDFGSGHVARCFLYDERAADQRTLDVESAPRTSLEALL